MSPTRQISHRQLEILIEFAEGNKQVVLGGLGKGPLGQQEANKAWEEVARRLNSIGGGLIRTPVNWKKYWHVLKCRTKAKAAAIRKSRTGTGGGPNKSIPLTELEERIINIIGKEAVEGIPGVRIPLDLSTETQPIQPSSTASQSAAPTLSDMGLHYVEVEMDQEVDLEMELEGSFFEPRAEHPVAPASPVAETSAAAAQDHDYAPAESSAAQPSQSSRPTRTVSSQPEPVYVPAASSAAESRTRGSQRSSRPTRNRDQDLPAWAYDIEERRIAVEERLADEIAGLGATNRAICLQQERLVDATEAILGCLQQLVQLLQARLGDQPL